MVYEIKTDRVDLGDGQFAEFFQELRHGTQKAVNLITRPFLNYGKGKATISVEAADDGNDPKTKVEGVEKVEIDLGKVNWDEVNDAIIVGQVKTWSFGPVSQETLDSIPESVRAALVAECNKRYGRPLAEGGGGN